MSTQGQTSDREFLDRLDAAIGCMHCERPLRDSAVSDYFCSEQHSVAWAAERTEYHGDGIDDDEVWAPDALTDLQPVSWIAPPAWRLPRSTGDLEADQLALNHACATVSTPAQQAACDLRQDDLDQRRRVANAKNWRLPRSTGDFWADDRACHEAAAMATTDAQRAACVLRRDDLTARRPGVDQWDVPSSPSGRRTRWGLDNFVFRGSVAPDLDPTSPTYVYGPYGHGPRSWDFDLTSSPIVHSRISWPVDDEPIGPSFGTRIENNLPGIRPATICVRGHSPATRMLTYELRRDSDSELLLTHSTPYREGVTWFWTPPPHMDLNGTHMRVLDDGREIARHQIIDSRTRIRLGAPVATETETSE